MNPSLQMNSGKPQIPLFAIGLALFASAAWANDGIQVPAGFRVSRFASDDLASNIYSMTVNSADQPVVAGPGYIKTLVDTNGDGVADQAKVYSRLPRNGAQGLMFEGQFLYCSGDSGLLRFVDANADGVADEPPTVLERFKTGGEHDAHAIRRGPDGWLYFLVGNGVPIEKRFYNGADSPVTQPQAGFLMRFSPDFRTREIVADGFRNAYDFDFDSNGKIYVYDSDGERDISLPWYRPTRVFQIRPGDNAGWISASWKRPNGYFDMPLVVGELGRGSPTGVCVYRRGLFPLAYQHSLFVADWTFGRVVVFKRKPGTEEFQAPETFARSQGQQGFAVTDLCTDARGRLYVSVGGRGTRGAVYRIEPEIAFTPDLAQTNVAANRSRPRLVELVKLLKSNDSASRERALEQLVGRFNRPMTELGFQQMIAPVTQLLRSPDRRSLPLLLRLLSCLTVEQLKRIDQRALPPRAIAAIRLAQCKQAPTDGKLRNGLVSHCLESVANSLNQPEHHLDLIRVAQLAMEGCGPTPNVRPMFHSYNPKKRLDRSVALEVAPHLQTILPRFDQLERTTRIEMARLAAMLQVDSIQFVNVLLDQINQNSPVPDDIHWLCCIAQMEAKLNSDAPSRIADALVRLTGKLEQQARNVDRNWYPRMGTLSRKLMDQYPIAEAIVRHPEFGQAEHDYLHQILPATLRSTSIDRFMQRLESNLDDVRIGQLNVVGQSNSGRAKELLRELTSDQEVGALAIRLLARRPESTDRPSFVVGLDSVDGNTIAAAAKALIQLGGNPEPDEMLSALKSARRLGWDKRDNQIRDSLIRLLQARSGQTMGYRFGTNQIQQAVQQRWTKFLQNRYPKEFAAAFPPSGTTETWERFGKIDWTTGDVPRGLKLYKTLQCAKCHDGRRALGPRLQGVAERFSKTDLLRAIVAPDEQVSDRYRAIIIQTTGGQIYKGTPIYDSVDGVTMLESSGETVRINRDEIESRTNSRKSLMPAGLLDQLDRRQVADLFAYLETL